MPQTEFSVPDSAFLCICGCRAKGCKTLEAGKTEYHLEHFGCRMTTVRFSSERAAVVEWNRVVHIKLDDIERTSGSADGTVSSNRHFNQRFSTIR